MDGRHVIVASNRGPVSFERDDAGRVVARRGAGGLVTALTGALSATGGRWIAAAMSEEDRRLAGTGPVEVEGPAGSGSYRVRFLALEPRAYEAYYQGISNRVLWFLNHYLWDTARLPSFDAGTAGAWLAYRQVNESFAATLAEEPGGAGGGWGGTHAYLVQDYHLALAPAALRRLRPDARIAHFWHTPFAGPDYLAILPRELREELLAGTLGADVVGFQAPAWAGQFLAACRLLPGASVDARRRRVRFGGREVSVGVYPVGVDTAGLDALAASEEAAAAGRALEAWLGDRRLVLRADRTELSKNVLRGFLAFEALLANRPDLRGRVAMLAMLNPSRLDLPEYRAYLDDCLAAAARVDERFGEGPDDPVRVVIADDYPATLAAHARYDVLLVNPTFDGMNLVAKEGPWLNRRDGALVLSENAGAFSELGRHAVRVSPFDVEGTAAAMAAALDMPVAERRRRLRGLRRAVLASPPERWVRRQLGDLDAANAAR